MINIGDFVKVFLKVGLQLEGTVEFWSNKESHIRLAEDNSLFIIFNTKKETLGVRVIKNEDPVRSNSIIDDNFSNVNKLQNNYQATKQQISKKKEIKNPAIEKLKKEFQLQNSNRIAEQRKFSEAMMNSVISEERQAYAVPNFFKNPSAIDDTSEETDGKDQ